MSSARFRSSRFICWLTFAADFIRSFSAIHSCDTTVRLHSSAASKTLDSSDQHPDLLARDGFEFHRLAGRWQFTGQAQGDATVEEAVAGH